jgi:hypothetical protein
MMHGNGTCLGPYGRGNRGNKGHRQRGSEAKRQRDTMRSITMTVSKLMIQHAGLSREQAEAEAAEWN